jgi:hypothetical protein
MKKKIQGGGSNDGKSKYVNINAKVNNIKM